MQNTVPENVHQQRDVRLICKDFFYFVVCNFNSIDLPLMFLYFQDGHLWSGDAAGMLLKQYLLFFFMVWCKNISAFILFVQSLAIVFPWNVFCLHVYSCSLMCHLMYFSVFNYFMFPFLVCECWLFSSAFACTGRSRYYTVFSQWVCIYHQLFGVKVFGLLNNINFTQHMLRNSSKIGR